MIPFLTIITAIAAKRRFDILESVFDPALPKSLFICEEK